MGRLCLSVTVPVLALFLALQSLGRFSTLHNRTFDLALYTRQAWGLARGDVWNPILDQHFLASHWSFPLLPLGLVGRLFGTAETLLVAQSCAFALAVWPLCRFAARRGGDLLALIATIGFFVYPNTIHVASYEFHPGNLALPGLAFAIDALDRARARALAIASLWVLACRADFALATLAQGVLAILRGAGLGRFGRALVGVSLGYLVIVQVVRARFVGLHSSADLHFGIWGGSPLGVIPTLFRDPGLWLDHFLAPATLFYLPRVLLPLGLLPLLRPRWGLIAVPFLALNLISAFPTSTELYSHYLTPAVLPLVFAAVEALAAMAGIKRAVGMATLVVAVGIASVRQGGAPWSHDYVQADYTFDQRSWFSRWVLRTIPRDGSVQAPDPLLPHLAERAVVHRGPPPERGTRFVVLDTRHRIRYLGQESLLRTLEEPLVRAWLARSDYAVLEASPMWVALARAESPRGRFSERFFESPGPKERGRPLCECLSALPARLSDSTLHLRFQVHAACPPDLALRIGSHPRPVHVRLLFDGYFSPAHLRAGDRVHSAHPLGPNLVGALRTRGLRVGALRASGAPPEPGDPISVPVPLTF